MNLYFFCVLCRWWGSHEMRWKREEKDMKKMLLKLQDQWKKVRRKPDEKALSGNLGSTEPRSWYWSWPCWRNAFWEVASHGYGADCGLLKREKSVPKGRQKEWGPNHIKGIFGRLILGFVEDQEGYKYTSFTPFLASLDTHI